MTAPTSDFGAMLRRKRRPHGQTRALCVAFRREGYSIMQIAAELGVHRCTVLKHMANVRAGVPTQDLAPTPTPRRYRCACGCIRAEGVAHDCRPVLHPLLLGVA